MVFHQPKMSIISRRPDGPPQSGETKDRSLKAPVFRFVDQTLRISNLRFLEGLLEIQQFIYALYR